MVAVGGADADRVAKWRAAASSSSAQHPLGPLEPVQRQQLVGDASSSSREHSSASARRPGLISPSIHSVSQRISPCPIGDISRDLAEVGVARRRSGPR